MRIKSILTKGKFKTSQNAYLISFAWLRRWKASVGYDGAATGQVVPAIDNSPLIGQNGELKKALVEHGDYEVIPAEAWNLLKSWYRGGPEIARPIEFDPVQKRNVPVTHLSTFNVKLGEVTKPVRISKFKTVLELKKAACKAFLVPWDLANLYETWNGQKDKELDDDKVIAKLFLKDRGLFILEITEDKPTVVKLARQAKKKVVEVVEEEEEVELKMTRNRSVSELTGILGYCGMMNLGNTCFLNAALQCVMHARPFVKYFLDGKWKHDVNVHNKDGTKGELVTVFAELLSEMWTTPVQCVSPQHLLSTLTKFAPNFRGNRQQDAHELLMILMNLINEDLNRAKNKEKSHHQKSADGKRGRSSDQKEALQADEKRLANEAWELHKAQNDSIVVDLFHGQFRSQLTCPECHKRYLSFEPFSVLSLPIPGQISKSPEMIFVPYDPLQPKLEITLPLRFGYNLVSVKRALSCEFNRDINIIFAVRHVKGDFEWLQNPPAERPDGQIICFEIPDQSKTYALSAVYVRKKGMLYDWDDLVDDMMLVPLDKQYPSPEQLQVLCEKRFSYLWSSQTRGDNSETTLLDAQTPQLIDFISSLRPIDCAQRLQVEIEKTIDRVKRLPFIATKTLKVRVNPAFMNAQNGFKWNRFFRPVLRKECECKETTAPTLDNCMRQFACGNALDESNQWICEGCRKQVLAEKSIELWKAPEILTIHLKRFAHGYTGSRKLTCNVSYPDVLDMNRYIVGEGGVRYRLFGVCEHHGDLVGGHYTAHIRNMDNQKWYFFNDSVCKPSDPEAPHNEEAYLLFYERMH